MVSLRPPLEPESEPPARVSVELPAALLADRYEILGLIGVGGMGSIYRARDRELDEVVALKMLRKDLVSSPEILERFRREVKLARRVTHRNVARVFDIGEHEGDKFLTMELIDGESLGALVAREGALSFGRIVEIVAGICAGLTCAHAAGVVHRDLKPDNVLMASDGRVLLSDFGIARAFTETGSGCTLGLVVGTPAYMAPEQVEGRQDVDALADVYSLGVVLYELLTGQRAWPGGAPLAVATARLMADPPDPRKVNPSIPSAVSALVLRCMARRREDRFPSMEALATALEALTWTSFSVPPPASRKVLIAASRSALDLTDKTVAVLPFRNAGPAEDDYLAEEITGDLIDSLSMIRGLKMHSHLGVLSQQGVTREVREIGRELGVQVVVEGSVRRARGNVRVSARLISVADGFQLWARRFDRPEQDVLSINDAAALAIAQALMLDRDAAAREAPSSPQAVDLYLRARHEHRKFWQDNQEQALALFAQAEALAPDDPMILSGKALALARLAFFTGRGLEEAFTAAQQAVEVAPNLGEAHLALGSALLQKGEWKLSVRELRTAVVRAPGLSDAHSAVGRVLLEVGDVDEAIRRL
ncbi:MAG: protein kinase domain-containing protein, partial [Byssovorax sp.]